MEELQLTLGSKYLIKSILTREQTMETEGTFKGVTTVGTSDALVMELGPKAGPLKGKIRLIPSHMIVSIDILEAAPPKDSVGAKRPKEENVQYG
jgi:hypothetical protein